MTTATAEHTDTQHNSLTTLTHSTDRQTDRQTAVCRRWTHRMFLLVNAARRLHVRLSISVTVHHGTF